MKLCRVLKIHFLATCLFIALSILITGEIGATTYYVSPDGNDSSSGSISAPFKTIQKAANIVNPGDTVIVANGIYTNPNTNGEGVVKINRAGTSGNWITFKSENLYGAKIEGGHNLANFSEMCVFFDYNSAYIRFEGFEIYNCKGYSDGDGIWINADDQTNCGLPAAHDIYLYRNKIHDICRMETHTVGGNSGFDGDDCTYNVTIDSNIIYNVGRLNPNTTPSATEASCTDANNVVHCYGHDHAIYFRGHHYTVINNIVYPEIKSGYYVNFLRKFHDLHDNVISNNTFYGENPHNNHIFTFSYDGNNNHTIQNNIFYGSYSYPIGSIGTSDTNIYIRNNLTSASSIASNCDGTHGICANNITGQDPSFVDPKANNFHLKSDSPAINKGLSFSTRAKDADGNSIVGVPDIGAYEYVSGSTDAVPPAPPSVIDVK